MTTKNKVGSITTIEEFMKSTAAANPEGGELDLKDIEKQLVNTPRRDVVSALKNSKLGVFVTGRKGHKSRWIFGPPATDAAAKMKLTRKYRKPGTNGRRNKRRVTEIQLDRPAQPVEAVLDAQTGYRLKIVVGDQTVFLPMDIAVVAA